MAIVHRLFFALQPLESERVLIGRHRDELRDVHGLVTNQRVHVTIAITADYTDFPAAEAHALHALGASVMAEPIAVSLARLAASQRSVALRPAGRTSRELGGLHRALAEPMTRNDLLRPGWTLDPHVTVAYRKKGKPFAWPIDPIAWESHKFVLIHSEAPSSFGQMAASVAAGQVVPIADSGTLALSHG